MSVPHHGDSGPPRRGGHDPLAPQMITKWEVTGRVRIGHTADYSDPAEPIIFLQGDDVLPGPDGTAFTDARCPRCIGQTFLALGEAESVLVIQHRPGCREMAALL